MSRTKTDKPCEAAAFAEGQVWKGRGVELTWDAWEAFRREYDEWLRERLREDRGDVCVHSTATWLGGGWSVGS